MEQEQQEAYICLVDCKNAILLLGGKGGVRGFTTEKEAIDYWENGYNAAHNRGYTWSMSACMNFIFFNPSIVKAPPIEELKTWLVDCHSIYSASGVMGGVEGFKCKKAVVQPIWKAGKKPRLISEDTYKFKEERERRR